MKRIGFFLISFFFLWTGYVHAETAYTLSVTKDGSTLKATYGIPTTDKNARFYLLFTPAPKNVLEDATSTDSIKIDLPAIAPGKTASQTITTVPTNIRYYVGFAAQDKQGTLKYLVAPKETFLATEQSFITKGSPVIISGKINTAIHPDFNKFGAVIYIDSIQLPDGTASGSGNTKRITSATTKTGGTEGIGPDGSFHWSLPDLVPEATYHYKIVLSSPTGKQEVVERGMFSPQKGTIASDPASLQADFDARSYRLLAPFPGLSVLLDPDLCQEQKLAGKNGQICDINEFLNYIFKLLVGLSAVALVLRLIYEGYQYIVTDIPFLKASAKGGFMEALGGLALALSAYLILNTLNPKLVQNDINVAKVGVGVEEYGESDKAFIRNIPGANFTKSNFPTGVLCPGTGGKASINSIAASWEGKATYSQALRGTKAPQNTFYLDCSSYVATVLSCAGITPPISAPGINTQQVFEGNMGAEKVLYTDFSQTGNRVFVKGKELQPGDLVGWRWLAPRTDKGHILIYVGNGKFRESQVGKAQGYTGKSVQGEKDLSRVLSDIKKAGYIGYLKRM